GDSSSTYGRPSTLMLLAGGGNDSLLAITAARHRSQRPEQSIRKSKSRPLKTDLRQAAYIAEAATFRFGLVLQKFNLDRNAARRRMRNLSGQQAVVRASGGADDALDFALAPFVAPNKPHFRQRVWLDPL